METTLKELGLTFTTTLPDSIILTPQQAYCGAKHLVFSVSNPYKIIGVLYIQPEPHDHSKIQIMHGGYSYNVASVEIFVNGKKVVYSVFLFIKPGDTIKTKLLDGTEVELKVS